MLLTLRPGLRTMQVFLDRPNTAVSETINSIPGGYAGFMVHNQGTRTIDLEIHRLPAAGAPAPDKRMRLVRPAVSRASAW